VKKWTADCEKCFGYWAKLKTDCAICMRVCPFSETPGSWRGQIFRRLVHLGTLSLARIWARRVLSLPRLKPKDWWASLSSPTGS
ncbi:MAG: reductive dehalogenase, partial [Gammaproteobacteria bacterium]